MPTNIDDFLIDLSMGECKSRLKRLSKQYASMKLNVSVKSTERSNYHFEIHAKGIARNSMSMTLIGDLKEIDSESTQVIVKQIVPDKLGYLTQYLWVASPVIVMVVLISSEAQILFGVPIVLIISVATLIFKQQDRDELLRLIHRTFEKT